jgi:hypothetical protein
MTLATYLLLPFVFVLGLVRLSRIDRDYRRSRR